LIKLLRKLLS